MAGVRGLDHINLRVPADRLEPVRAFYTDLVGLRDGPRPPMASRGYWLYADDAAVLHLRACSRPPRTSRCHRAAARWQPFGPRRFAPIPASSLGRGPTSTPSFFLGLRANRSRRVARGDREQALSIGNDDASLGQGNGYFSHVAFACTELEATRARLDQAQVPHRIAVLDEGAQVQIFVVDPAGITVELNFCR